MELSLPGAKVPLNIRSREQKFHLWNFRSRERKFHNSRHLRKMHKLLSVQPTLMITNTVCSRSSVLSSLITTFAELQSKILDNARPVVSILLSIGKLPSVDVELKLSAAPVTEVCFTHTMLIFFRNLLYFNH